MAIDGGKLGQEPGRVEAADAAGRFSEPEVAVGSGSDKARDDRIGQKKGAGMTIRTNAAQRVGMADDHPKITVGADGETQRRAMRGKRIFGEAARNSQAPNAP